MTYALRFRWTVSRAKDSYGYNICTLYVNEKKVAACNGGGYDMKGTSLGNWVQLEFEKQLLKLKKPFYGLSFHDPNYNPGKALIEGKSIEQREKDGEFMGLERYQAFHAASSQTPTKKHVIPRIDGACGMSSVDAIIKAIGGDLQYITSAGQNDSVYTLNIKEKAPRKGKKHVQNSN